MSYFQRKYIEKYHSDRVKIKVFLKPKGVDEYDNYAVDICIEQKLVFKSFNELESLNQIDKDEIINRLSKQLYRDNRGTLHDWEIVKIKREPIIYWKWILPLTLIPILLYSIIPSFFTSGEIPPLTVFKYLLPEGFALFAWYLSYYTSLYYLLYFLWTYKKFEVRIERAVNRIVLISIIVMTYSIFLDFSNRQPTEFEKFIAYPFFSFEE